MAGIYGADFYRGHKIPPIWQAYFKSTYKGGYIQGRKERSKIFYFYTVLDFNRWYYSSVETGLKNSTPYYIPIYYPLK